MKRIAVAATFVALMLTASANAYMVAYSLNLQKLQGEADFIFKAEVISSQPAKDGWFKEIRGFEPVSTELRIIEIYKGRTKEKQIAFHHFAVAPPGAAMYMPQHYRFEAGRSYIIFADITKDARALYAFYIRNGLTNRARKFRALCIKNITYDIDYYFKAVDAGT